MSGLTDLMQGKIPNEILLVIQERTRQEGKWGEQNHNDYYWLGILGEESGEVSKALIENSIVAGVPETSHDGRVMHLNVQELNTSDLEKEIIHVAAVAIAWLEAIHRRKYP